MPSLSPIKTARQLAKRAPIWPSIREALAQTVQALGYFLSGMAARSFAPGINLVCRGMIARASVMT